MCNCPLHSPLEDGVHLRIVRLQGAPQHSAQTAGNPVRLRGREQPNLLPCVQQRRLHALPLHGGARAKPQAVRLTVRGGLGDGQRAGKPERHRRRPSSQNHAWHQGQRRAALSSLGSVHRDRVPAQSRLVPRDQTLPQEPLRRHDGASGALASDVPLLQSRPSDQV
uniref:Transmembrane protein 53 n=1 Tax=Ictalurus furcatus TaxID=66913 RepID=E3TDM8_ICTFU|nr:transmembrane protein 53 [Ictalurus furcatus]